MLAVYADVPGGSGEFVNRAPVPNQTLLMIALRSSAHHSACRTRVSLKNFDDGTVGRSWKVATSTAVEGNLTRSICELLAIAVYWSEVTGPTWIAPVCSCCTMLVGLAMILMMYWLSLGFPRQ